MARFRKASLRLFTSGLLYSSAAMACGPDFPNNLLDQGDNAVLAAPVANFAAELDRMNLVTSKFKATATEATDAEMADLSAALKKSHLPQDEIEGICRAQAATREALRSREKIDFGNRSGAKGADPVKNEALKNWRKSFAVWAEQFDCSLEAENFLLSA